jgi:hypothetical protein
MQPAPPPRSRPAFDLWLAVRKISYREAAEPLQTSHETVRLICLPFDDADRRVPNKDLMARIYRWTAGEIPPSSFYDFGGQEATAGAVAAA